MNFFALSQANHLKRMKEFANITDETKLIEYLKTANSSILADFLTLNTFDKTLIPPWAPTIENPSTNGAFITKTPDEIYSSNSAPVLDAMFSFTSQVSDALSLSFWTFLEKIHKSIKKICVILKEYITFNFELTKSTEPLLKEDLKEVKFQLPFENFTESAHPNVIQN